ncbi:MAG TPA: SDR family oxidoreductase [Puia sp.]|jgi:UDP-glucose 4-epimerase|nr:SDR family oxidoreductase [Puia sp.]
MSSILITGGTGFVGGRIAKKLSGKFGVIVSSRKTIEPAILALHGPIRQVHHQELLSEGSFPKKINTVIHLAALNEWDSVQSPSEAIRVNVDETRILLENAQASGVENFIYFSTAHIYGSPMRGTITELSLPAPIHPYSITHRAAEDYVLAAAAQKKIHSIVIRLSNSFGAPVLATVNRWTLLANDLAKQAIEKGRLSLLSNGCQYRDFICLTDVENIIHEIIKRGPENCRQGIYNLGSGKSMKVIELAEKIVSIYRELFGERINISFPANSSPTEEAELNYRVDRLLKEGFVIGNDFEEEIKKLLLFCHQNFTKIA